MGLHDPFGHLKHKLWPKERLGVKLTIWLLITKSQESTRFPCVQVVCDIMLESSWQRLQLYFITHFNQRSAHKIMGPQSCPKIARVLTLGISKLSGQNAIWMWASWSGIKYTIRGKVVASPKSKPWWILWVQVCPWFVLAPKVLQLCSNQLVVWFVQICVND
jgi:hypothetical protein